MNLHYANGISLNWMLRELFQPFGYTQAMLARHAKCDRKDKPYGLTTGDLYHILDCYHNIGLHEDVFELGGNLPFDF